MEKEEFEGVHLLVVHRGKVTDWASPAPPRGMSPSPAPPPPAPASFLSQASVCWSVTAKSWKLVGTSHVEGEDSKLLHRFRT